MGVCEVVESMASAVKAARQPLTPRESLWIDQLRKIADFHEQRRLDLWESACKHVSPHKPETVTEELLAEVEMLGLCNLYQAFQPQRTRAFYERLIPFFAERGVQISEFPDLSTW